VAQAKTAFAARLHALARTNQQLIRSNWRGVDLSELVRTELECFADRTMIEGINIMLDPQHAQNFSLVLHELTTNAIKYGALSNEGGKVKVFWTITNGVNDNRVTLKWQERGGGRR
jgi:two-component system CheB/CheR fusion protein